MELKKFQEEIITKAIHYYSTGEKSLWLSMPVASGKTVTAITLVERLSLLYNLKRICFVARHKIFEYQFQDFISQNDVKTKISFYTYTGLSKLIKNDSIPKDTFQIMVFDEAELESQMLQNIFEYFTAFKIGFARPTSINDSFLQGPILKYSVEEILNQGDFLSSQKDAYKNYFNILSNEISSIDIGTNWTNTVKDNLLRQIDEIKSESSKIQEALKLLLSGKIETAEIIEMSYKKEQLEEFKKLLYNKGYFLEAASKVGSDEYVWQTFFENNSWIFGFGLNYVFNSPLDGKKLEQTVQGYSVTGAGKRVDAFMKTTGIIQSLCFGEIKTHKKEVLKNLKNAYRAESWAISEELAGGIAQVQKTVQKSLNNITSALSVYDEDGFKKNEQIYLLKPKAFLIIGCLNEFKNENDEIHEEKFASFELFRRSISDVEIITFDELYERANAMVNKKYN